MLADASTWRPARRPTTGCRTTWPAPCWTGDITVGSHEPGLIRDPRALALMDRTTVVEDPALTAFFPHRLANRVTVRLSSGEELVEDVRSAPGSTETPMTDADFERKPRRTAGPHLSPKAVDTVLAFAALRRASA